MSDQLEVNVNNLADPQSSPLWPGSIVTGEMLPRALYENEVAIVSGGAGFIGSAICEALAAEGASLVIADIDEEKLQACADRLRQLGARVTPVSCDVRSRDAIEATVQRTYDEFGRADFLVNVPGIAPVTPVLEVTKQEWDSVMAINLDAPFLFCQAFARRAVGLGIGGKIVNISSGASRIVRPGIAPYSASKAGLDALSRALAIELAPYGIHVHAVNPGLTENDYNERVRKERPEEHRTKMAKIPFGRMGKPEEVAAVVAFLLSPSASYMTGCVIDSDGGYSLGIPRYD